MDYGKKALEAHRKKRGKLSIEGTMSVTNEYELSIAYTRGPFLNIATL